MNKEELDIIKEQVDKAKWLLSRLEIVDPFAILAGGAPRNWANGKPAKDLDFYIHRLAPAKTIRRQLEAAGLKVMRVMTPFMAGEDQKIYQRLKHLKCVFIGEMGETMFQVMVMDAPTFGSVVNKFGTSVSRIWWKGSALCPESSFLLSYDMKVIFMLDGYTSLIPHVKKMVEYHPGFELRPWSDIKTYTTLGAARHRLKVTGELTPASSREMNAAESEHFMEISNAFFKRITEMYGDLFAPESAESTGDSESVGVAHNGEYSYTYTNVIFNGHDYYLRIKKSMADTLLVGSDSAGTCKDICQELFEQLSAANKSEGEYFIIISKTANIGFTVNVKLDAEKDVLEELPLLTAMRPAESVELYEVTIKSAEKLNGVAQ